MGCDRAQIRNFPGEHSTEFGWTGSEMSCEVLLCGVVVGVGKASNKKAAKTQAYEQALKTLLQPYIKVTEVSPGKKALVGSDTYIEGYAGQIEARATNKDKKRKLPPERTWEKPNSRQQPVKKCSTNLADLILMEHETPVRGQTPMSVLQMSAAFNKAGLDFDFTEMEGVVRCVVRVQGQILADHADSLKATAKAIASDVALTKLRQVCNTIQIKSPEDNQDLVSRDEITGDVDKQQEAIPESNKGNQMLKKMGWTGGGVGKDGSGIAEPVMADTTVIRREGLGHQSMRSSDFMNQLRTIVRNYARSENQNDLAFEPMFDKEERVVIHNEAKKLGLKSQSKGKSDARYLILSRKRSPQQLLQHLVASGGSTGKYKLVPPQGWNAYPAPTQ